MKLIDRHLLGSFIPPFGFGLAVTTFLLMINVLQNYINLFLEKGIRFDVATEVLVLSLGHTIALTVPMATLIGWPARVIRFSTRVPTPSSRSPATKRSCPLNSCTSFVSRRELC